MFIEFLFNLENDIDNLQLYKVPFLMFYTKTNKNGISVIL